MSPKRHNNLRLHNDYGPTKGETGVVKPVYPILILPLTGKGFYPKGETY